MRARDLSGLWAAAIAGLPPRVIHETWGPRAVRRFLRCLGALPIMPDGETWAPMDWRAAAARDWHLVIAARAGLPCHPAAVPGVEIHGAAMVDSDAALPFGFPTAKGWRTVRAYEALHGAEIVDLVAYVPAWKGEPLRRLLGRAVALGDSLGLAPEREDEDAGPLPISPSLAHWMKHAARGAVFPLGDRAERRDYLRGLACGLVAADAEHAAELRRTMKRDPVPPPPMPEVWLEAADATEGAA